MISTVFYLGIFVSGAIAGTPCPPRYSIYPCSCVNIPQSKKSQTTIVNCHRLQSTDSLSAILTSLRSMNIDVMHIYDSFWDAHTIEKSGEDKKVLPTDWLNYLHVKELEIVDTTLSANFACQSKLLCKNTLLQRFSAINSSSHEKIITSCPTNRQNSFSWTGCMQKLRHFQFTYGKLTSIDASFFPMSMKELVVLNLTHNEISLIEPRAFRNLGQLKSLDLSHNLLTDLGNIFTTQMNLDYLDVSWNSIYTLGNNFFGLLPRLVTFKLDNNEIVNFEETQWKSVTFKLINIDMTSNPVHCDCSIQWVNSTFHINVVLKGQCATPEEYENTPLRKASRFLSQRCDGGTSVGTRSRPRSTTPMN